MLWRGGCVPVSVLAALFPNQLHDNGPGEPTDDGTGAPTRS